MPSDPDSNSVSRPIPGWVSILVLVAAVGGNLWVTTLRWNSPALIDHEFRQAQTAVITRYIDEQDNFSIDYETPILGEPWQIPLEFPLYQWTVVGLSRALDVPHVPIARGVSLASFYLTLAALWVLLGAAGLSRSQRGWGLVFVLVSPVYLFYSRAFLIDPFATMASAWFLAAFERTLVTRRWGWALLAAVAATAAALVKSVVFFVWLVPAAIWGAIKLGQVIVRREGWRRTVSVLGWGILPVLPGLAALKWWIDHTDAIKAEHPSGWIFTSENLSTSNFGSFSLASRFNGETWHTLFERWREAVVGPEWVVGLLILALFGIKRYRTHALVCLGLFLVGQIAFPYAYALQDYYFYAGAIFLGLCFGFLALGWLEHSRLPIWLSAVIAVAPLALMAKGYHGFYYQNLMADDDRDWVVTRALRELLPPDSILVVAGGDWSAVPTYQTRLRSLMIRNGLEYDSAYLARAFNDLEDNRVGAMMFIGATRENANLKQFAIRELQLDPEPTVVASDIHLHIGAEFRDQFVDRVKSDPGQFEGLDIPREERMGRPSPPREPVVVESEGDVATLPHFNGMLRRYRAEGDIYSGFEFNQMVVGIGPPTEFWLEPPSPRGDLRWAVFINPASYENRERWDSTDGVGFAIHRESSAGKRERLAWRYLNPWESPSDRGIAWLEAPFALQPGDRLVLQTVPGKSNAYDWALMMGLEIGPAD